MERPQNRLTIEELRAQQTERRRSWLVGAVGPTGDVTEFYIGPDKDAGNGHSRGIQPVHYAEGEQRLTQYGRENGWTLLEKRCREDGCPEKYQAWKDTVHARQRGLHVELPRAAGGGFDMSAIYPPSVIRQRAEGGTGSGPRKVFVPGKGEVDAADLNPEDERERLLRLAGALGDEPAKAGSHAEA